MSKILVIKDEEKFRTELNLATIQSACVVADVMDLLKNYEEEVVEFEAEVMKPYLHGNVWAIQIPSFLEQLHMAGEPLQVFVVKPKKPEVKDENSGN